MRGGNSLTKDPFDEEIDKEIDEKIKDFSRSWLPFHAKRLRSHSWNKPIKEIYYDWCTVLAFSNLVKADIKQGEGKAEPQQGEGKTGEIPIKLKRERYTTMMAYLWLAKGERDPGQAWNMVNSADKLFPLIIPSRDFRRSLIRLRTWDKRLLDLRPKWKARLKELDLKCSPIRGAFAWNEAIPDDIVIELNKMVIRVNLLFSIKEDEAIWTKGFPEDVLKICTKMHQDINLAFMGNKLNEFWTKKTCKRLREIREEALEGLNVYHTFLTSKSTSVDAKEKARVDEEADIVKNMMEAIKNSFRCIKVMFKDNLTVVPGKYGDDNNPDVASKDQVLLEERCYEYCKQANRAQLWYSVNSRLTLRYELWNRYAISLFLFSILAITALEFIYWKFTGENVWWYRPFLGIWLFGLVGASLTTNFAPRDVVEDLTSVQLISKLATVRILSGGAGAIVIFLLWGTGLVASSWTDLVMDNPWAFALLGVIAGFSEELWVNSLNSAGNNLDIVGRSTK